MGYLLETLERGTPVWCREHRIGEVRDVYAEGEARLAEYLAVHLDHRAADVLIPTKDVAMIEERGVVLFCNDLQQYDAVVTFAPETMPNLRKLNG